MKSYISHRASIILKKKDLFDQFISSYLQNRPEFTSESFNEMVVHDELAIAFIKSGKTETIPVLSLIDYELYMHWIAPSCLEEVMAAVALLRTAPVAFGLLDSYRDHKTDFKQVTYVLPSLAPLLTETYGKILYIDQFYSVMKELVGFTRAESDDFLVQEAPLDKRTKYGKLFFKLTTARGLNDSEVRSFLKITNAATLFDREAAEAVALILLQGAYFITHEPEDFMNFTQTLEA